MRDFNQAAKALDLVWDRLCDTSCTDKDDQLSQYEDLEDYFAIRNLEKFWELYDNL